MSAKNRLQEIFQKIDYPLPQYYTQQEVSDDHLPQWISTVTIVMDKDKWVTKEYKGEKCGKKKVAECSAALIALKEYKQPMQEEKRDTDLFSVLWENYRLIVLVDIENTPNISNLTNIPPDVLVVGVLGHCHNMATKHMNFPKYVIKSALKDAADHALTFLAGMISQKANTEVLIISRDHYAEATVLCLQNLNIKSRHLPHVTCEELLKIFSSNKDVESNE
jgi:hypothetical protein